jgi:hypothetical protein
MRTLPVAFLLLLAALALLLAGCSHHAAPVPSGPPSAASTLDSQLSTPPAAPAALVHVTDTGKRYHRAGCRSLAKSDTTITRAEAASRGLTPCKVCKP